MNEPGVPAPDADVVRPVTGDATGGPDGPRALRAREGAPTEDTITPARSKLNRVDPPMGPSVRPGAAAAVDAVAVALQQQMAAPAVTGQDGPVGASPAAPPLAQEGGTPKPSPASVGRPPQAEAHEDPLAVLTQLVPPTTAARDARRARRRGGRVASRSRAAGFWRYGFPVVMVLITLAVPVLAWAGRKTVLQSTDGKVLTEITDPNAPGWQALTDPTPTLLLVQTDAAGVPTALTVMSLTGEGVGGLVFMPMTTVLELPDIGMLPLNAVAEKTGMEGLQKAVEGILGAGMTDVRVVSPSQWADLVTPVGSITVSSPDDVFTMDAAGARQLLFAKGQLTLAPKDVAAYLATTSPGENDLNRLVRQKAFWDAWLAKVGQSSDPAVLPGETDSGLGKFVRVLAGDRVESFPLPVQTAGIPGSDAAVYLPIKDQVSALVARLVPFPVGAPPGARPRVRLLDGTGKLDHGLKAAPLIVEGGGQIDQIGNASALNVATTELVYYDETQRANVEKVRAALGVGAIVKGTTAGSAVDVTITLGTDYLNQPPRELTPVSVAPSGTATTTIVGVGG